MIQVDSNENIINIQNEQNQIVVVNEGVPEILITQPVTTVIQVATPGTIGPVGPSGSIGPSGSSSPFTLISGNFWVTTSSIEIQGGITGSLQGTSSYALTASYALNANFDTSSFVTTSSFNNFTSSYNTGSFSGSLVGTSSWSLSSSNAIQSISASYASGGNGNFSGSFSGSGQNLFDIPSTAITGLNLSQIASGSATASIDPVNFTIKSGSNTLFNIDTVSGSVITKGLHVKGTFSNYNEDLADMGSIQTSDLRGYGTNYITDKTLNNVIIGSNGSGSNGGIRVSTAGSFEINILGTWFPVSSNIILVEDTSTPTLAGFVYEVKPTGYTNYIEIMTGASVFNYGNNGYPITNAWKTSMGSNPPTPRIGGRTI